MHNPRISLIKREQRKSLMLRELSTMLHMLCGDEPKLRPLFISQVTLSDDGSMCYVYFSTAIFDANETTPKGVFEELLPILKLYKASMRKCLGEALQKRYVPDIRFVFDEKWEKVDKINQLLNKVQDELAERDATPDKNEADTCQDG